MQYKNASKFIFEMKNNVLIFPRIYQFYQHSSFDYVWENSFIIQFLYLESVVFKLKAYSQPNLTKYQSFDPSAWLEWHY